MTLDELLAPLALRKLIPTNAHEIASIRHRQLILNGQFILPGFMPNLFAQAQQEANAIKNRLDENFLQLTEDQQKIISNFRSQDDGKDVSLKDLILAITDPKTTKPTAEIEEITKFLALQDLNSIDKHSLLINLIYAHRTDKCSIEDIATILFYYLSLECFQETKAEELGFSAEFVSAFSEGLISEPVAKQISQTSLFNFADPDHIKSLSINPSKIALCNSVLKFSILNPEVIQRLAQDEFSVEITFKILSGIVMCKDINIAVSGTVLRNTASPFDIGQRTRYILPFSVLNQLTTQLFKEMVILTQPVIGCFDFKHLESAFNSKPSYRPVTLPSLLTPHLKGLFFGITTSNNHTDLSYITYEELNGYKDQTVAHREALNPGYLTVAAHDLVHTLLELRNDVIIKGEAYKMYNGFNIIYERNLRIILCMHLRTIISELEKQADQNPLLPLIKNIYCAALDSTIADFINALESNKLFAEIYGAKIIAALDNFIHHNSQAYGATSLLELLNKHFTTANVPEYIKILINVRNYQAMMTPIDERPKKLILEDLILSKEAIVQFLSPILGTVNDKEITEQLSPLGLSLVANHYNQKNDQLCNIYVASCNRDFSEMITKFNSDDKSKKIIIIFQPSFHDDDWNKQRPRAHRTLVYLEKIDNMLHILHADSTSVASFELYCTALINERLGNMPRVYYTMQPITYLASGAPLFLQTDFWNCATHTLRFARKIAKDPDFLKNLTIVSRTNDDAPRELVQLVKYQLPISFIKNADTPAAREECQRVYGDAFTPLASHFLKYPGKRSYQAKFADKYKRIATTLYLEESQEALNTQIDNADAKNFPLSMTNKL